MQKSIVITVPAALEHWEEILEKLGVFFEICQQERAPLRKLLIAAEELFVNSVQYAYSAEYSAEKRVVEIMARYDDVARLATIRISDNGIPYNPLLRTDPDVSLKAEERQIGGLGIFMVKKLTNSFTYNYVDGKNQNEIQKILD